MEINVYSSPAAMDQTRHPVNKPGAPEIKLQQPESSVVSPTPKTQKEAEERVLEQVESVNDQMNQLGLDLAFSVDENTQYSVVKVIDRTTDEVIKQFPSEGALKVMEDIQNYLNSVQEKGGLTKDGLTGTLFNETI